MNEGLVGSNIQKEKTSGERKTVIDFE
jgi:hypothetical protein